MCLYAKLDGNKINIPASGLILTLNSGNSISPPSNVKAQYDILFQEYERRKNYWLEAAKDAPSLYQYLKDNIHGND